MIKSYFILAQIFVFTFLWFIFYVFSIFNFNRLNIFVKEKHGALITPENLHLWSSSSIYRVREQMIFQYNHIAKLSGDPLLEKLVTDSTKIVCIIKDHKIIKSFL